MPLKWILRALWKTRLNLINCLPNKHIFYVNIICHDEQSREGRALKCQYNDRDRDCQTLEGQDKED